MAWGDNYRYQARDHDAQATRLIEEAEQLEAEAERLQRDLANEAASSAGCPDAITRPPRGPSLAPPPIPRHFVQTRSPSPVSISSAKAIPNASDPAGRRELANQQIRRYLEQTADPVDAELEAIGRNESRAKAPGIRRLAFLIRTIPFVTVFAFLPQIVPHLPKVYLNALGPGLATLVLVGALTLIWLAWAVLPRLRNCRLPLAIGLGVFIPPLSAIIAILCLAMPERETLDA